jgi:hypothetical protein
MRTGLHPMRMPLSWNANSTERTLWLSIRSRLNVSAARAIFRRLVLHSREALHRAGIIGAGDLWVTEFVLTYDGQSSYTVSIMELSRGLHALSGSS